VTDSGRRDVVRILRERARALAQRDEVEHLAETEPLATFTVGGHPIGVPVAHVGRASALRSLTEIPGAPEWLVGISSVEGHLVSLLDLVRLLALPRRGVGDLTALVVVAARGREIGLLAEQLHGIEDVPARAIAPLPGATGPLTRIARTGARELLVLDVPLLFADARLSGSA
jgi:purine-binding chemotaxis protein CheW